MKVLAIRFCLEMPFDSEGRHATGREILTYAPAGNLAWENEYEDWATVDMPNTETEDEYFQRYCDWKGIDLEGRWEEDLGLDNDIETEELDEDLERWFFGEGGEDA